jgi:hypothetical protein
MPVLTTSAAVASLTLARSRHGAAPAGVSTVTHSLSPMPSRRAVSGWISSVGSGETLRAHASPRKRE